jgi:hypothetical protein
MSTVSVHRTILVKVNAYVDAGVAPLVTALNAIDGVVTLASCEQGPLGLATVCFMYGADWRELAVLLDSLANEIRTLNLCCGSIARLEWMGSDERPRAHLAVMPEHIAAVADAVVTWSVKNPPESG